ncbi:acyltransferase [Mangrovactinospora gilvigrisea]|uniref:Acyltransferase n=1 Tax=Mangrovactinospora gilvigrisea TaxID=1428644 RepID=A0A1J7BBV8_9ACTN|nr:acyltransferase [Mangrovactinospora gilvigrisea]
MDGLRLVAALAVCLYHYAGRGGPVTAAWGGDPRTLFPALRPVAVYGCLGVELFFVISGFVICLSSWGRTVGAFARSRVSRLFPAYWVAVVLVTAVFLVVRFPGERPAPASDILANLTMSQSGLGAHRVLGVCWTLWIEAKFYLLWAVAVVWRGVTYRRALAFGWLWLAAVVLTGGLKSQPLVDQLLIPQYAPFFIGGLALHLVHRFGGAPQTWGLVGAAFLVGQYQDVQSSTGNGRTHLGIIIADLMAFLLVAGVALGWFDWAKWRWLTTAGALTYPFYLIHEHLGWVAVRELRLRAGLPDAAVLPLTVAVMLALAWLLHRWVEQPLGPWLKRALARMPARLPAEPVPEPRPVEPQKPEPEPVHSAR